jgi:predicted metalloprotease
MTSTGSFVLALACSLTLSACASPIAPSAKPENFYEAVRSDVENFWADIFSSHGETYTPISKMELFTDETSSRCGIVDGPAYCRLDQVVYLESRFMQEQMTRFGKFGPAMIIAHEAGHHVQNLLGLTGGFTIQRELQADCLAGGWIRSADDRRLLDAGDYQEAVNNFLALGDPVGYPWFARDAHGTVQERQDAFRNGYVSGWEGC